MNLGVPKQNERGCFIRVIPTHSLLRTSKLKIQSPSRSGSFNGCLTSGSPNAADLCKKLELEDPNDFSQKDNI